jgi:large conductance mechanosensitive channel
MKGGFSMLEEFRRFAVRGNVVDMAVGIIIGGAFGTIAKSLVEDILTPPLGLLLGNVDFKDLFWVIQPGAGVSQPYPTLADAQAAGAVTINYGVFLNNILSFLLVALAMFFVVRAINRLQRPEEAPAPTSKTCPQCATEIPLAARKCPNCTSVLEPA